MGSRALTQRGLPIRYSLLLLLPLVGLTLLLIGLCIINSTGYSRTPRKVVAVQGNPPVRPSSGCCATYYTSSLLQDKRGWLLDPIFTASHAHISGAATDCKSVHVGQIKAKLARGNHRHRLCNETLLVWGAEAKFRVENPLEAVGYTEAFLNVDEVGVFGCPAGRAHAVVNLDNVNTLHILGCQDGLANTNNTEYNVWTNLNEG